MFKNLTSLSYKRNFKEAFGFYVVYLILGFLIAMLIGGVLAVINSSDTFDKNFEEGFRVGNIIAVVYSFGVSMLLVKEKKLYKNFIYIFLVLSSGILALLGGISMGLILPAYITTRESQP